MIKVHLQNPTIDGQALLIRMRVFSLTLDDEIRVPKVAKVYNSLASNDLLTITISSPNLCCIPQRDILTKIVVTNFCKGQEYKILEVHKLKDEAKAYLVGASLKQCKKLVLHEVTMNQEIYNPKSQVKICLPKKSYRRRTVSH
jgi:hypothetical protein